MIAKINKDYRITVPQEILNTLGVKAGDEISFVSKQGTVYLFPGRYGETSDLLKGQKAMEAIRKGESARWKKRKQYYQNWEKNPKWLES